MSEGLSSAAPATTTVPATVSGSTPVSAVAAVTQEYHLNTATIDPHLISPFPELPTDTDQAVIMSSTDMTTALTAAAISSAMANAQLKEDTLIPVVPGVTAEHVVLDSLQRQAHEQVLEIMSSYQHSHSHRRRSSVEAAAAASSVLASIANSSAAANKAFSGDLSDNPQHSAAAALLAASGMHGVMLPTIPSESVSLRNTPGPAESFESPFGTTQNAAPTNQQHQRPPPLKLSQIGDDDDLDSDDSGGALAANGMPLTPDAPGSGRPGSLRHLTPDERRARRLQRNRLAAKECRQKKKAYITNLESQVNDLQMENAQLRKELEELNAKLTLSSMRAASTASTPTLDIKTVDMNGTDDASSLSAKRARFSDSSL